MFVIALSVIRTDKRFLCLKKHIFEYFFQNSIFGFLVIRLSNIRYLNCVRILRKLLTKINIFFENLTNTQYLNIFLIAFKLHWVEFGVRNLLFPKLQCHEAYSIVSQNN